jgi:hypothetical protein
MIWVTFLVGLGPCSILVLSTKVGWTDDAIQFVWVGQKYSAKQGVVR